MAKNDYFRVVFIILKFLYENMKKGNIDIPIDEVIKKSNIPDIPQQYFDEIIKNLIDDEYIDYIGESVQFIHDSSPRMTIESIKIKPKGIEYLQENSMMKKIAKIIETVK